MEKIQIKYFDDTPKTSPPSRQKTPNIYIYIYIYICIYIYR